MKKMAPLSMRSTNHRLAAQPSTLSIISKSTQNHELSAMSVLGTKHFGSTHSFNGYQRIVLPPRKKSHLTVVGIKGTTCRDTGTNTNTSPIKTVPYHIIYPGKNGPHATESNDKRRCIDGRKSTSIDLMSISPCETCGMRKYGDNIRVWVRFTSQRMQ
ncbi:unnamed protein product [Ectocarpus fasciculatus]